MDVFANALKDMITDNKVAILALVAVSWFVIGGMFVYPSEETRAGAKRAIPYVIIGTIIMLSAVAIANWFGGRL